VYALPTAIDNPLKGAAEDRIFLVRLSYTSRTIESVINEQIPLRRPTRGNGCLEVRVLASVVREADVALTNEVVGKIDD